MLAAGDGELSVEGRAAGGSSSSSSGSSTGIRAHPQRGQRASRRAIGSAAAGRKGGVAGKCRRRSSSSGRSGSSGLWCSRRCQSASRSYTIGTPSAAVSFVLLQSLSLRLLTTSAFSISGFGAITVPNSKSSSSSSATSAIVPAPPLPRSGLNSLHRPRPFKHRLQQERQYLNPGDRFPFLQLGGHELGSSSSSSSSRGSSRLMASPSEEAPSFSTAVPPPMDLLPSLVDPNLGRQSRASRRMDKKQTERERRMCKERHGMANPGDKVDLSTVMPFIDDFVTMREELARLQEQKEKETSVPGTVALTGDAKKLRLERLKDLKYDSKIAMRTIKWTMSRCFKAADTDAALKLYKIMKEKKIRMPNGTYNGVLNLCQDPAYVDQGVVVLEDMKAAGVPPTENSYTFLIREKAARGANVEAFTLINQMLEGGIKPRLRTYAPVLEGLCQQLNMDAAWDMWDQMGLVGVLAMPDQYVQLLVAASKAGQLYDMVLDGTLDAMFVELSYNTLETEMRLIEDLIGAFNRGKALGVGVVDGDADTDTAVGDTVVGGGGGGGDGDGETATAVGDTADAETPVAQVVSIDTGLCECCGSQLRSIGLEPEEKATLRQALFSLVGEKGKTARSTRNRYNDGHSEIGALQNFVEWLEVKRNEGVAFTVVIDAANVAYHKQNVVGGRFKHKQIDLIVKDLESKGETVLVICSDRYLLNEIPNSTRCGSHKNKRTTLDVESLNIIQDWINKDILYRCGDNTNDDWYWMYVTVAFDDVAAAVITNDAMRDHKLGLIAPMPFLRWKQTQIQKFDLSWGLVPDAPSDDPKVALVGQQGFTRDIQRTYEGRWHLPIAQDEDTLAAAAEAHAAAAAAAAATGDEVGEGVGDWDGEEAFGEYGERLSYVPPASTKWLCIDIKKGLERAVAAGAVAAAPKAAAAVPAVEDLEAEVPPLV